MLGYDPIIRDIPNFPNYQISEYGEVYNKKTGEEKKIYYNNGYKFVSLDSKTKRIHRLLAETFIANPENKPVVDHIDRDKLNNSLKNLRWATVSENSMNSVWINKTSGVQGVRKEINHNKEYWVSFIIVGGKGLSRYFKNNADGFAKAVNQRKYWEKIYQKEFCPRELENSSKDQICLRQDNKIGHKNIHLSRKDTQKSYYVFSITSNKKRYSKHFPNTDEGLAEAIKYRDNFKLNG